jgi:GTP-binding protein Era
VAIAAFKEKTTNKQEPIVEIQAVIFVERESQKMILLGRKGSSIKKLGTSARLAIEEWLQQKVFLDLHVKVREKWRNDQRLLRHFGYDL